jgi:SnoaL-like protein
MGDNSAPMELLRKAFEAGSVEAFSEAIDAAAGDEFVEEWPQSGERIRGKATAKRINEGYSAATGTTPAMRLRRIVGEGDVRVVEATIDYGDGTPVSYIGIAEFKGGKLNRITEYFASPFEAPAWRADFVERMDPVGVG